MTGALSPAAAPAGPAYTVVLICHVAAALVGMVVLAAGLLAALGLLAARDGAPRASVRSYFAPGPNRAGRVLWLVPVFGAALLAMSGGSYRPGQAWVVAGLALWVGAIALCEGVLWRAERRVRDALAAAGAHDPAPPGARRACRVMCVSGAAVLAVLVAATVLMVAKP